MPLALFILYVLAEIFLLIRVGNAFGAFNLLLCLFASAILGLWAIRSKGREVLSRAQEDLAAGRPLHGPLADGLLLFCGGVLLIVPGFLSDALGLLLLIAPLRRSAGNRLGERLNARPGGSFFFFSRTIGPPRREEGKDAKPCAPGDVIIEGTAREVSRSDIPNGQNGADGPAGRGRP